MVYWINTHLLISLVPLNSGREKMYDVVIETIQNLPAFMASIFTYASNPGLIMSVVLLMV